MYCSILPCFHLLLIFDYEPRQASHSTTLLPAPLLFVQRHRSSKTLMRRINDLCGKEASQSSWSAPSVSITLSLLWSCSVKPWNSATFLPTGNTHKEMTKADCRWSQPLEGVKEAGTEEKKKQRQREERERVCVCAWVEVCGEKSQSITPLLITLQVKKLD